MKECGIEERRGRWEERREGGSTTEIDELWKQGDLQGGQKEEAGKELESYCRGVRGLDWLGNWTVKN